MVSIKSEFSSHAVAYESFLADSPYGCAVGAIWARMKFPKASVLALTIRLECFRVSRPEVDDSSRSQTHFMEDYGVGTQPVLLGSRLLDIVHLHE